MFMNAQLDGADLVNALVKEGLPELEAEKAVALVPCALSRPILERLGASIFLVYAKTRQGQWVEIDVQQQPYYQEVLMLVRQSGWLRGLDAEGYQAIVSRTSELAAADKAVKAGDDVKGASIKTYVPRVTAEQLGYEG